MKAAEPLRVEKRHPLETQGAMDITCQSDPIQTLAVTSPLADDFISCPAPGSLAAVSAATAASAAVSCLQLLRLLLMGLFHLLPLRVTRLLFIQLHVFLVLFLLELVAFLLLLRSLLVLLLLVLPVPLRVARIWSAPCHGRKVARMNGCAGLSSAIL